MSNFHSDAWVMEQINAHYQEALEYFPAEHIVGIFCQGSTNYGLDTPNSDIDTKLIITPSFKDIVLNKRAVSTTHVRANDEHIDFKDIRLMLQTFRKQNLNFLEILFTDYKIINPMYAEQWQRLVDKNEDIANYNPFLVVKAMKGVALEKYHALKHPYPAKIKVLEKYGYDPKQLHHLVRIAEYIERYLNGEDYKNCLKPINAEFLLEIKNGKYNLQEAEQMADQYLQFIEQLCAPITKDSRYNISDLRVDQLLDDVQYHIIETSMKFDLSKGE